LLFQQILCLQLAVRSLQANLDTVAVKEDAVALDPCRLQDARHAFSRLLIDLQRRLGTGNLHRWRFAKEVRQCIDQAEQQGKGDDKVLPERVTIHGCLRADGAGAAGRQATRQVVRVLSVCLWEEAR
jgi:hypothetical protein